MRSFFGPSRVTSLVAVTLLSMLAACASGMKHEPGTGREDSNIDASGRSMQELFEGRFPGVEVRRATGGGISIRIRGTTTVLGNNEPLYIIDGARVQSGAGGLLFLDPQEIAKIEVLKDIGQISIYGSEGANGVIIITTKRVK